MGLRETEECKIPQIPIHYGRGAAFSLQKKWMEPIWLFTDCKVGLCKNFCFKLLHNYADFSANLNEVS